MTANLAQDLCLAEILAGIAAAEARARFHDLRAEDRDRHAEAGQRADEAAEAGRRAARALIENAFPGVSWAMIAGAAL
jgi:hypothetical protein